MPESSVSPSINTTWYLESVRRPQPNTDQFTIEEMRRNFSDNDRRGKIRVLKRAYSTLRILPFELAELGATDWDRVVRAWLASYGRDLDYRSWCDDHTRDQDQPERDLQTHLRRDPDEYVRACALSNRHIWQHLYGDAFAKLIASVSQLERLGLMRNYEMFPHLGADLYDLTKEFGITIEERAALVNALLDNRHFVEHTQYWEYLNGANKDIWERAIQWPEEYHGLVMLTFQRIDAPDNTKLEIYRAASKALRLAILAGCETSRNDKVVEEIGLSEKDNDCRELAYAVAHSFDWKTLQRLFGSAQESVREAVFAGVG